MCSALGLLHQMRVADCKVACKRANQSQFPILLIWMSSPENQTSLAKLRSCFELALFCRRNVSEDVMNYVAEVCSSSILIHWDFRARDLIANVRRGMLSVITRAMHSELSESNLQFILFQTNVSRVRVFH